MTPVLYLILLQNFYKKIIPTIPFTLAQQGTTYCNAIYQIWQIIKMNTLPELVYQLDASSSISAFIKIQTGLRI